MAAEDDGEIQHAEPIYKRDLLEKAKEAQEPVTEIDVSDKGRTTRVHAIQEYDGVAWRAMIRYHDHSDDPPSVKFAKSYHDSEAKAHREWWSLATGRLSGPQDLPSWESLFTVFNAALGVYNREVRSL